MSDKLPSDKPKLPPPPEPPEPYMCCDSGCGEACVFEIYYEQKRAYEALIKQHSLATALNDKPSID